MRAFDRSNGSRARPVTPSSDCRCNAIDTSFYHHHRVECRFLGSVS